MKNRFLILLLGLLAGFSVAEVKAPRANTYAPFDFVKYNATQNEAMGDSIPRLSCLYTYNNNYWGNATVYCIHKNGTNWWKAEAKRKHPDLANFGGAAYLEMAYNLLKADSTHIGAYHLYAFFIDKKDLVRSASLLPEEEIQRLQDKKRHLPKLFKEEILDSIICYVPKPTHTIVLYERKAGTTQWVQLQKHIVNMKTNADGTLKEDYWELQFVYSKTMEINRLHDTGNPTVPKKSSKKRR